MPDSTRPRRSAPIEIRDQRRGGPASFYEAFRAILGGRFIAYSASLARAVGGVHEAILLQQLCYWSERASDRDGWFYKTRDELADETALNRYQQEKARGTLRTLGVIEEERRGVPATMYFRVNWEGLLSLLTLDQLDGEGSPDQLVDGRPSSWSTVDQLDGRGSADLLAQGEPTITESTSENTQRVNERRFQNGSESFSITEAGIASSAFWSAVLEDLPGQGVPANEISQWLRSTKLVGRGPAGELIVRATTDTAAQRIRRRHLGELERAAAAILGRSAKIVLQGP